MQGTPGENVVQSDTRILQAGGAMAQLLSAHYSYIAKL
jgi:hypothetical protein